MLRFTFLISLIFLIAHNVNTLEENGKCITVIDKESKENDDTLYCQYVNEEQLIEEIKKDQNKKITQISIWLSKISRIPLQDVLDTDLKDRLKHLGVIGNKVPLNIDEKTFEKYNKIEALEFQDTIIHEMKNEYLKPLINLRRLEWRNTTTEVKHKHVTEEESPVEKLVIEKNKLTTVTSDFLKNMPHLKSLILQYDQIEEIKDEAFVNNKKIHILELNDNLLSKVSKELFREQEQLYLLDLSNNPMKECVPITDITNANIGLKNLYIHGWPCLTLQRCLEEYKKMYKIECIKRDELVQYHGSNCTIVGLKKNGKTIRLSRGEQSYSQILGDTNIDDIACVSEKNMESLPDYKRVFVQNVK